MNIESLIIQITHILFLGVFLLYVGIYKPKANWVYNLLIVLGILAIIVFSVKIYNNENLFWLIWHVFFVGIVLLWTGIMRKQSFDFLYKLLIIIGSAAIGYHAVRLIQNILNPGSK